MNLEASSSGWNVETRGTPSTWDRAYREHAVINRRLFFSAFFFFILWTCVCMCEVFGEYNYYVIRRETVRLYIARNMQELLHRKKSYTNFFLFRLLPSNPMSLSVNWLCVRIRTRIEATGILRSSLSNLSPLGEHIYTVYVFLLLSSFYFYYYHYFIFI